MDFSVFDRMKKDDEALQRRRAAEWEQSYLEATKAVGKLKNIFDAAKGDFSERGIDVGYQGEPPYFTVVLRFKETVIEIAIKHLKTGFTVLCEKNGKPLYHLEKTLSPETDLDEVVQNALNSLI